LHQGYAVGVNPAGTAANGLYLVPQINTTTTTAPWTVTSTKGSVTIPASQNQLQRWDLATIIAGNNGHHWLNVTIYDSSGNTTLGSFTEKRYLYLNAYTPVNYTWWTSMDAGSYKMLVQIVNSTAAYVVYVDSPSTSTLWTMTCM
jgi:hypothetical protein